MAPPRVANCDWI
jgi:hypothetical protein